MASSLAGVYVVIARWNGQSCEPVLRRFTTAGSRLRISPSSSGRRRRHAVEPGLPRGDTERGHGGVGRILGLISRQDEGARALVRTAQVAERRGQGDEC